MKKILLISSNSSGRGGGERYLIFLAEGLIELGFQVHVLLSTDQSMDVWSRQFSIIQGIIVHRLQLKSLSSRPLRFIQSILDFHQINLINNFCISIKPDGIVVNQQYDEDGLDYVMGALRYKKNNVCGVMHMPMTAQKDKKILGDFRGWLLKFWYRKFKYKLILVSKGAQAEILNYYGSAVSTSMVNNSVPFQFTHKHIYEKNNCSQTVGFTGQLVEQKNLYVLIRSWLKARRAGFDCNLLLVGDGPLRNSLESFLHKHAPDNTWKITGWVSNAEDWLDSIDIFLMSSHFEGLPLSLVEAVGRGIFSVVPPFNGAQDVAEHAHWVWVAKDNSITGISNVLIEALNALKSNNMQISENEILKFKDYFSLKRMAFQVSEVLNLNQ